MTKKNLLGKPALKVKEVKKENEQEIVTADKPRKLLLRNELALGDVVVMTAALRDLHKTYPNKFITDYEGSCKEVLENNPYITKIPRDDPDLEIIEMDYGSYLNKTASTERKTNYPYHFLHGYAHCLEDKLGVPLRLTDFKGDIYLSQSEKSWQSQVEEMGIKNPYWIIVSGGKECFTAKWSNPNHLQDVVDYFKGKITFVQVGEKFHWHPLLKGTINLIGRTDLRQLIRLVYHSVGVVCPVTAHAHLAAAVPTKPENPFHRACVVLAGSREPSSWEAYPMHQYLKTDGMLSCSQHGACWKNRCQPMEDGDDKDTDLCLKPVEITVKGISNQYYSIKPINGVAKIKIPQCLDMITPFEICNAIEKYYNGGLIEYNRKNKQ